MVDFAFFSCILEGGRSKGVFDTKRRLFCMSVFTACLIAFATCVILLSLMAVVMSILTRIFPPPLKAAPAVPPIESDAGVESAIVQAVARAFPGARVSRIQELKR